MPKFFVNQDQINNNKIKVIGEDVNHIRNVLRLNVGQDIYICEKETTQNYECTIEQIEKDSIECKIIKKILDTTESDTYIHIFQGLPKSDKLEMIIEKCTEIGVKEITPIIMIRTVVKLEEKDKNKKLIRWRKIAEVASKQSGRDAILKINDIINFKNIFEKLKEYDIVLVAYEKEKNTTLKSVITKLDKSKKIAVLIGPEGGIDDSEIDQLNQCENTKNVTLGKRILRTETAPLVISSNILYELEE